ncbi:endolytic transglycosylase MltG [Azospira restricta]|uniref:Endolytic murein transglycosylase n=1 Tax=Azospira restricta TaxID=404405 RepID=A0A974PXF6_9RHOO|nr:endolytic transglycosylase MltG [Azospira restricta]QRJ62780.1 endolytic transglycosylase MltG [Azospira restricta]
MLKLLRNLILLVLLAVALAAGTLYWLAHRPLQLAASPLDFTVAAGSSLRSAEQQIAAAGVALPPRLLELLGRLLRVDAQIKAGSYEIVAGITPLELLRKLTRGDVTQAEIAFIEGWTFRQLRDRLDAHPDLRHDSRGLAEAELLRRLGIDAAHAEGWFFPDTYLFAKQSSDLDVLARAHRTMRRHVEREWAQRAPGLPYRDARQALIMASIVEKETGREADRPLIAAVFVNRLRAGMLLQTDPTVIYGLGEGFDGNLRKRDLLADTPYNTYTRPGLPPTPIAMPGLASLRAALNPAASDVLYFVARGDGSSQFSRTLDEHNQAVARYQLKGEKR